MRRPAAYYIWYMPKVKTQPAGPSKPLTRAKPHLMIPPDLVDRFADLPNEQWERLKSKGQIRYAQELELVRELLTIVAEHIEQTRAD